MTQYGIKNQCEDFQGGVINIYLSGFPNPIRHESEGVSCLRVTYC